MMAFDTDIMQQYIPQTSFRSLPVRIPSYFIHYIIDDEYTIGRQAVLLI